MTTTHQRPLILFVDDEPQAQKYFRRGFGSQFDILTAGTVNEARSLLEKFGERIAVLLTDQRMPSGDGVSLLRACKQEYPEIVRLITTAYTDIEDAIDAVNHGEVSRYITKPWDLGALREALVDAVDTHRQRQWESVLLRERQRTMMAVAGHMAHEMRTPLLSIRSAATGIERYLPVLMESHRMAMDSGANVTPIRRHHQLALEDAVQSMRRVVDRANAVIDLMLANCGARQIDPATFTDCAMHQCVETAIKDFPFQPGQHELVHWRKGPEFEFRGSPELMIYVIHNLLKNALRAVAATGHGDIRIWTSTGERHNGLHVEDDGVGIDPAVRHRIFEDFARFSGDQGGVGIGLGFCRRVMQGFAGHIDCNSEPGRFTRFDLWFPVIDPSPMPEDSNPS